MLTIELPIYPWIEIITTLATYLHIEVVHEALWGMCVSGSERHNEQTREINVSMVK